jgi:hypothetical protein
MHDNKKKIEIKKAVSEELTAIVGKTENELIPYCPLMAFGWPRQGTKRPPYTDCIGSEQFKTSHQPTKR